MRIYRRAPGGALWVDFWHDGERIRRSAGTADRRQAQEYGDRLKAQYWRTDRIGERPAVTWDAAVLDWLEAHQHLRSLSDRKDQLRWATKHLRGRRIDTINRAALDELGKLKAKEGVSSATVNRHLAAVSAILGHAAHKGWIDAKPTTPKRQEAGKRLRFATQAQARKLIDALPAHLAAMAEFSLATGLRQENVTHLEWSRVDVERRVAWVDAEDAKGKRTMSVPLSDAAIDVLQRQRGAHRRWVFPYRGGPIDCPTQRAWAAACRKAKLRDFTWHDLRHTWASWHVQNGTPLAVLQELGHWRSIAMVMRYAHLAPSHLAPYAGNAGLVQNRAQRPASVRQEKAA